MIEDLTDEELLDEFESRDLIRFLPDSEIIERFIDRSLMSKLKKENFIGEINYRNDVTMINVPAFADYAIAIEDQKPTFGQGAATIIVIE